MARRFFLSLAMALALGSLPSSPASAEWGYTLIDEMMSPYCPGRALSECPSPDAEKLRVWILDQEKAGRSQEEVSEELYGQFGEALRQSPKAEGVGVIAYVIPMAVFGVGGLLVAFLLSRKGGGPPPGTGGTSEKPLQASGPAISDEELERELDEELSL